jgi:hypothetical protein
MTGLPAAPAVLAALPLGLLPRSPGFLRGVRSLGRPLATLGDKPRVFCPGSESSGAERPGAQLGGFADADQARSAEHYPSWQQTGLNRWGRPLSRAPGRSAWTS